MNSIKYFNPVEVPNWQEIVLQLRAYIYNQSGVIEDAKSFFYFQDIEQVKHAVPLLFDTFKSMGLPEINYVAVTHINKSTEHAAAHSDNVPQHVRINFPIENCDETYTIFYKNTYIPKHGTNDNGVPYLRFYLDQCEEMARYELTTPTALLVNIPHTIERTNKTDPRISVSVGFVTDPWHLLQ